MEHHVAQTQFKATNLQGGVSWIDTLFLDDILTNQQCTRIN